MKEMRMTVLNTFSPIKYNPENDFLTKVSGL